MMANPKLGFVCVGPQRTATSWLDRVLRRHPEVTLPEVVKETYFLDKDFSKGWDWYWRRYFPSASRVAARAVGEIAPTLFFDVDSVARLRAHAPDCRIIVCLREPVARSLSLFEHEVVTGRVPNRWQRACAVSPSIIEASRYRHFLGRWSESFGSANVILISNKAVAERPQYVLDGLCGFLGISRLPDWHAEAGERYGVAARPRSRFLALVATRVARTSRALGLHTVANWGKQLGLKRFLFSGGKRPQLGISAAEKAELVKLLAAEADFVERVDVLGICTLSEIESAGYFSTPACSALRVGSE